MKKTLAIACVLALVLAIVLCACGTSSSTTPATPSPSSSAPSDDITTSQTEQFYALMAKSGFPDAGPDMLSIGLSVCDDWRQGATMNDEINELVAEGFRGHQAEEAGAALAVGTYVWCPQYGDRLRQASSAVEG